MNSAPRDNTAKIREYRARLADASDPLTDPFPVTIAADKIAHAIHDSATKRLSDTEYRHIAKRTVHDEGVCEIDDNAPVSRSSDGTGAYVAAWVWVSNPKDVIHG